MVIQTVKRIIRTALHSSGALDAVRKFNRRAVRILMYHQFSPDKTGLMEQCEHIRRYYQPLSLKSICESLETGTPLPHNSLAITVDDGYRNLFLDAYPVFLDYHIPLSVFLISDLLNQET